MVFKEEPGDPVHLLLIPSLRHSFLLSCAVTGYLFSRGPKGAKGAPGDQIGIGGNYKSNPNYGKLFVFNGNEGGVSVPGRTIIPPHTWNHLVFVREGKSARLYLNGDPEPEFDGEVPITTNGAQDILIGGRNDFFSMTLNGNMTQFALFPRALTTEESLELHNASGRPKSSGKVLPPQKAPKAAPTNLAMGVRERKKPADTKVHKNGESKQLGEVVARGFLSAIEMNEAVKIDPAQSGRLQLARWLTHPQHPLTARVMVNRIWQVLFGHGIVRTPNNFGLKSAPPSHPDLLNWLATEFVENGWRIKPLIREIVLSETYRQSSLHPSEEAYSRRDAGNMSLWKQNRRRMDAEALRDAIGQVQPLKIRIPDRMALEPRNASDAVAILRAA